MPTTHGASSNGGFRPEELGRREFQKSTYTVLNHHAAQIGHAAEKLRLNSEFMADQSVRIDQHSQELARLEANFKLDVAELRGRQTMFQNRSFLGRLAWLFAGR